MFAFLFKLYKPKSRMETECKQQQPEEVPLWKKIKNKN
jgi:hypothetical protein